MGPTGFSPPHSNVAADRDSAIKPLSWHKLSSRQAASRTMPAAAQKPPLKALQVHDVLRLVRSSLVGSRPRSPRNDARDHRWGPHLSAPVPGAPRAGSASDRIALLSLLAVAHDRAGD